MPRTIARRTGSLWALRHSFRPQRVSEQADRERVPEGRVIAHQRAEIAVDEPTAGIALVADDERGRQVASRQVAAVGAAHAERLPLRQAAEGAEALVIAAHLG